MQERDIRRHAIQLYNDLKTAADRDPDQEVHPPALRVVDAVVKVLADQLGENPIVRTIGDVISPEAIEAGEPVRSVDAMVLVGQLLAALGPEPARVMSPARMRLDRARSF